MTPTVVVAAHQDEDDEMPYSTTYSGYLSASSSAEVGEYRGLFNASIEDPAAFWARAAQAVSWIREPRRVLDDANPPFFRWFPDGELNTCANALDRHVADGRAEQPALIYDSPVTGSQRTYTYANCWTKQRGLRGCSAAWACAKATGSWCTCR